MSNLRPDEVADAHLDTLCARCGEIMALLNLWIREGRIVLTPTASMVITETHAALLACRNRASNEVREEPEWTVSEFRIGDQPLEWAIFAGTDLVITCRSPSAARQIAGEHNDLISLTRAARDLLVELHGEYSSRAMDALARALIEEPKP